MQSSRPNDGVTPSDSASTAQWSFVSGKWLPHQELSIGVDDVGFRQGVVAVERLRTYQRVIFALDQHLDRWTRTTETLRIDGLPPAPIIQRRMQELCERNGEWINLRGDVGITMVATPGTVGSDPTFMLHLNALDHDRIQHHRLFGQPLVVTDVAQPDCASWPRTIKTRARIHYYLADHQARDMNREAVGVLLDQDGSVTETSIANLAVVRSGAVYSPPADRVLGGITQQIVETLAAQLGLTWEKQAVSKDQLSRADEVLLMGTDGGVWFAHSVDGVTISNGKPGPIFERLRDRFDAYTLARADETRSDEDL